MIVVAAGTRNVVALAVNPADGGLYATLHGRDSLAVQWLYVSDDVEGRIWRVTYTDGARP
jgi:glucose/arabinose dehydrogenase